MSPGRNVDKSKIEYLMLSGPFCNLSENYDPKFLDPKEIKYVWKNLKNGFFSSNDMKSNIKKVKYYYYCY